MEEWDTSPEIVGSEREIFSHSGPTHLTVIDWANFDHKRSVAASLVQGAYILERDRQQHRQGPQAQATPWWDSFHFRLIHPLIDQIDNSIFGAIYEFKPVTFNCCYSAQHAPRYVIAFRGIIQKPDSIKRDHKLCGLWMMQKLHNDSRFQTAMQAVQDIVAVAGGGNLWLAGHSLGSAIALLAGKNMTKRGYPIESYLFNPPFPSAPIEKIFENEELKQEFRTIITILKAGLAFAFNSSSQRALQEDAFAVLSTWLPYLFVNPGDCICSEYIGYFKNRKKMEEIGAGKIGRLGTQNSIIHLLSRTPGKNLEPTHLIPSAYLTINFSECNNFRRAHGLRQWWNPNSVLQSVLHQSR